MAVGKIHDRSAIVQRLLREPGKLFGAALMLFIALCNPFGLRDASDQNTETWLQRLFALSYPVAAQEQVVVVLIDDDALQQLGQAWPLSYDEHARWLRRLLSYQPRGVFVDVLFSQRRDYGGDSQGLLRVIDSYRQRDVPLLLADYREADGRSRVLPEIAASARLAQVNWEGHGERYPLYLTQAAGDPRTPALQLYAIGCQADCAAQHFQAPLLLRWGYWSDAQMRRYQNLEGCGVRGQRSGWREGARLVWNELFRAQQDSDVLDRPQRCAYTRTLYLDQLRDPRVAELLRDRYVLLGAHLRGIPDVIISPVQGQLPAVYSHAMALDNLLSFGDAYWRDADPLWLGLSLPDWTELALVLAAALIAMKIPEAPLSRREGGWRWLLSRYWFWFLVLTLATLVLSALFSFCLHLAPLDALGLLTMIALFYGYLAEPRLAAWWQQRPFIKNADKTEKERSPC